MTKANRVLILIENTPSQTTISSPTSSTLISPQPSLPSDIQAPHIQDIDFRRLPEGAGRIIITLSEPSIIVDMRQEGTDIILEFINTRLPKRLDRRLDVSDFGTPVSFIDTFPKGVHTRMNITVKGRYEHHSYQSENIYTFEIKEKVEEKTEEPIKIEERKYTGKLVSFNFQDIDVRAVLKLLFDLSGENPNIIISNEISGSVTLRLKNIPWDQARDIILEARDLGMQKFGNVVMIDLKKNLDARKQRKLKAQKKIKELEPLRTQFITINYAKAADMATLLGGDGMRTRSFLSGRGNVSMDERTNTLIIQDTATKIAEIRKLIASLDTPVRQVLIESRVVIASSNFAKDLGVKFGLSVHDTLGTNSKINDMWLGGKIPGDTLFPGTTGFHTDNLENYIVSLPINVANPAALGLAIGKIGSHLLQLELSAMQTEGAGEILSNPRVITGNQQEASILQGTQIPFMTAGGVGTAGTLEWKDATLELRVTPQITPDDRVNMELFVKKDAPATFGDQISIEKREVKTNVLVNNGETVVLGGVYERTTRHSLDRVPFFGDLPLIGYLFRRKSNRDDKSELLIFVTPKILKETH